MFLFINQIKYLKKIDAMYPRNVNTNCKFTVMKRYAKSNKSFS